VVAPSVAADVLRQHTTVRAADQGGAQVSIARVDHVDAEHRALAAAGEAGMA
jgi:hypothetical protein